MKTKVYSKNVFLNYIKFSGKSFVDSLIGQDVEVRITENLSVKMVHNEYGVTVFGIWEDARTLDIAGRVDFRHGDSEVIVATKYFVERVMQANPILPVNMTTFTEVDELFVKAA